MLRGLRDDAVANAAPIVAPLDLIAKLTIVGLVISFAQLGIELVQFRRRKDR